MKKSELKELTGKKVKVTFKDGKVIIGILHYTDIFKQINGYYVKGNSFCIFDANCIMSFKVSHTKKVEVVE